MARGGGRNENVSNGVLSGLALAALLSLAPAAHAQVVRARP